MKDSYKCGYSKCKSGGIVSSLDSVIEGNKHYHLECLQDKNNRIKIKELFLDRINSTEVISVLQKVINTIIDIRNISSEYLLYSLTYVINHHMNLNHAQGMYYIINNDIIKKSYLESKTNRKVTIDIDKAKTRKEVTFQIQQDNNSSWKKLLE